MERDGKHPDQKNASLSLAIQGYDNSLLPGLYISLCITSISATLEMCRRGTLRNTSWYSSGIPG